MFDCNSFLNRKGWKQRELAQRLNIGTSTVGMWCTGKSTPSYDVILQLFKLGVTIKELFGEEVDNLVKSHYDIPSNSKVLDESEKDRFRSGMAVSAMTKEDVIAIFKEMHAKGEI